jgi:hypothetical protein
MWQTFRNQIARLGTAFAMTLITCCVVHGQEVRTNYLPGTDFSKYHTYSWVTIEAFEHPDQILDSEIKQSIDSELRAKGFTRAESSTPDSVSATGFPPLSTSSQPPIGLPQAPVGLPQPPDMPRMADSADKTNSAPKADLVIGYQVAITHETQWNGFGSFDRFPGSGFGTSMATATSSTIPVGTLVLDVYDPATKRLVWVGFATKTINLSKDQQKNQKNLDKIVQKLLKDFPPKGR